MGKIWKLVSLCLVFTLCAGVFSLLSDRKKLEEGLIRLHVVANSDSDRDQRVKLQVRDAVLASLQTELAGVTDVDRARDYLQENLPKIQAIANHTLKKAGFSEQAVVSLGKETFDKRIYDTFTLPAGVYEALRITIGEGEGHNWWCVAFPTLCLPATSQGFEAAAVEAGFSETMTRTLAGEDYEIRFYLLDAIGRLENAFFEK